MALLTADIQTILKAKGLVDFPEGFAHGSLIETATKDAVVQAQKGDGTESGSSSFQSISGGMSHEGTRLHRNHIRQLFDCSPQP